MSKTLTIITTTYRAEKYLPLYFKGIMNLQGLDSFQFLIIMNEPTQEEKRAAYSFQDQNSDLFRIIQVPERETIGASMNRGFSQVGTPYCSFLDVDDIRLPDSYLRQIATLEQNQDADFTYGDFIMVAEQGKTQGIYHAKPEFDLSEFTSFSHASPTQLFRTELLERMGGWDEQFISAGDLDFNIRAALNCRFKKTPGLLLYYTSAPGGVSHTKNNGIESVVIWLRYGSYRPLFEYKVFSQYVPKARLYNLEWIKNNGLWHSLEKFVPDYRQRRAEKDYIKKFIVMGWRIIFWAYYFSQGIQAIRLFLIRTLKFLGIYEKVKCMVAGSRNK
jgi:glycosyltransferase involved in cell wall biosynthesis